MGGQLTVSSREHHGSTFTFILPYKVSTLSDTSDDPDELSDMVDHDAATDINDDDTNSGFFQFQPRTLGTLFSSNGSGRTQKLTPNGFGLSTLPRLNGYSQDSYSFPSGNITAKEMSLIEDACSEVDVTEAVSEPESSLRYSPESDYRSSIGKEQKCHHDANRQLKSPCMNTSHSSQRSKDVLEIMKWRDPQEICQMQVRSERSSECTSSNSPEMLESMSKPKILLVEDNKINVMVTRSLMRQLGHDIVVVNNGVEALRAIQSSNYDLVLMVILQ